MILVANNSTGSALTLIYPLMGDLTVSYKFIFSPKTIFFGARAKVKCYFDPEKLLQLKWGF
jgi:hypothetical protein